MHLIKPSYLFLLCLIFIGIACSPANNPKSGLDKNAQDVPKEIVKELNNSPFGTFLANLPCIDCLVTRNVLKLNKNMSYSLQTKYIGKSNEIHSQSGKFEWDKTNNKITIPTKEGLKYYLWNEETLQESNKLGDAVLGLIQTRLEYRRPSKDLLDKYWVVEELNGKGYEFTGDLSLRPYLFVRPFSFETVGFTSCNTFSAIAITSQNSQLSFEGLSLSERDCIGKDEINSLFKYALDNVESYEMVGDLLLLLGKNNNVIARLKLYYIM